MKLEKLVFKTESGKKIELTLEEAKQLFEHLNPIFGNKQNISSSTYDYLFKYNKQPIWSIPYVAKNTS